MAPKKAAHKLTGQKLTISNYVFDMVWCYTDPRTQIQQFEIKWSKQKIKVRPTWLGTTAVILNQMELTISIENIDAGSGYPKTSEHINALYKATGFIPQIGDCIRPEETNDDDFDLTVIERYLLKNNTLILYVTDERVLPAFIRSNGSTPSHFFRA